jgi:hypothetical protein
MTMGKLYGNDFSQTTISRFEALNLSFKNMCKLKPLLEKWLDDVTGSASTATDSIGHVTSGSGHVTRCSPPLSSLAADALAARRRKKRTNIDHVVRQALENCFRSSPKPTVDQINVVAHRLGMDREVVQVWFCNRRQKEKRVHPG